MTQQKLAWLLRTLQCCKASHVSTLFPVTEPAAHSRSHSHSPGLEDDYILLTPVKVDASGTYLSHDLTHRSRRKRSEGQLPGESLHYKLNFLGQELQLDLTPSNLLAEGFTVQTLGKQGTRTQMFQPSADCLYQGSIRNEKRSAVALSTCGGLSGLVRSQQVEYLITPLPHHLALSHNYTWAPGHRPHVLYRRSAERRVHRRAGHGPPPQSHLRQQHHRPTTHLRHRADPKKQHFCGRRKKYMPQPPVQDPRHSLDERDPEMRWKRSLLDSRKRQGLTVEILVVADKRMLEKHGNENVTTYVLTVMNMVSSLFKDGTIGTDIRIAIVSLLLLEQNPSGLVINHHADQSLNSFCQWQAGLTGKNGKRHDHAVLLTGLDICSWKNEPCDTLGFAPISGMCSKHRSCTINEDTGLGLAFTIAHESGHNFGMIHDGEGNPCRKTEGNIMSPTLAGNNGIFSWSACSRQYLNRFLSTAQASCLVDEPKQTREYRYPTGLPGQMYDADTQCKWQFGPKAKLCSLDFVKDICKALWCHRSGHRCETKFMPAAEGTVCGLNMWCRRGQCLVYGDEGPKPIDGQWSPWSEWSECSRTCGGGVTYKERHCDSPKPQYGGRFCYGSSRVYRVCNAQACQRHAVSFRAQQCAEYNSRPFRGWYYKWKPYLKVDEEDICKLYCIAEDFDFFFAMSSKVKDGTPCVENRFDVCIDGICEAVGCDRVLGSNAVVDACGVCNGDNSTCTFFRGQYHEQHRANEYYSVVTVPAGARSIRLYELDISTSYLAVRSLKDKYYLTGDWTVDWPGKFSFGGASFHYQRSFNKPESLYSTGPTNETLLFEILLQGKNPGIGWEYTIAKAGNESQAALPRHNHTWLVKRSDCSASCAGGKMMTTAYCLQDHLIQVNSSLCEPRMRPATGTITCNTQPCPASWSTGKWSECSSSCGGGQQTRQIQCFRKASFQRDEAVPRSMCPPVTPAQLQPCHTQACPPEWTTGAWSQCSKTCGRGLRKRDVFCRSTKAPAAWSPRGPAVGSGPQCHPKLKPKSQEVCVLRRCPKNERLRWITSAWTECSVSCGAGLQKRVMKCAEKTVSGEYVEFPQRRCRHLSKPKAELERGCNPGACPTKPDNPTKPTAERVLSNVASAWYASPWQQCTVTCGGGVQTRSAHCLRQGRPATGCLPHQRPATSRACHTNYCPSPRKDLSCVDFFSWCHLVPQHGVCGHKFYGKQCCKSCSKRGR
ncbi:A disintegrin and metalloproteinase with thrombospondin motifs 18 [Callorhinchus milii]|uniref:A disintegrin and metalloproteinase with thrombospondin motifs 18 n=1 Tax=Callorhinchus milii TaxID=7868 RepID=UPI001C3F9DF8|nr:A disintegrin and metalloproteinase with thrombospondin motifs 18 [Callorhinchus milii]